ncbi:MAG TPA: PHP domain-containing protein [Candidatus Fimimorpha excrementavium]|nr:PHP domain-containing protein [Candidatus Fimimorpha excrementavium]
MKIIDLHVHSNHSDGTLRPSELVELAYEMGLSAFALTDHDTVSGVEEAVKTAKRLEEAKPYPMLVIPGIEVSAVYKGREIHILGLNVDDRNRRFLEILEGYKKERNDRNDRMAELLAAHGFDISKEKLEEAFPGAVLTRAHFARFLKDHNEVESVSEAFDKYIGVGCPCYLPKKEITPEEAISSILLAGGHPVLAHPPQYKLKRTELEALVRELVSYGLEGIEAIYSTYSEKEERGMRDLAKKFHLYITGGSDFHGSNKPLIQMGTGLGGLRVPFELLEKIL